MQSNKQVIVDEIVKEVEQGRTFATTLTLNETKWNLSRSTFIRRWKDACEQHAARQQAIQKEVAVVDIEAAVEARKSAIMTVTERKEYLTKLIKGEIEVPFTEVRWDVGQKKFVTIPFTNKASHASRIAAIAELNKMEGSHAPAKFAQTTIDGEDVVTTKVGYGSKNIEL
jgi:hypothetical protein